MGTSPRQADAEERGKQEAKMTQSQSPAPSTRTERVTLTLGLTPGYGHNNESAADPAVAFAAAVESGITAAAVVQDELGIYPSFVAHPARVGYRHEWGCPSGGEFVLVFQGERNPEFCADPSAYRAAWRHLAELLKKEFCQTTATLVVAEVELSYLK
jgi:hypothetical protein